MNARKPNYGQSVPSKKKFTFMSGLGRGCAPKSTAENSRRTATGWHKF